MDDQEFGGPALFETRKVGPAVSWSAVAVSADPEYIRLTTAALNTKLSVETAEQLIIALQDAIAYQEEIQHG